jgi:putative membrane protein
MILFFHVLILIISFLHFYFMMLEMVLWQKPLGLKTFRNSPEKAETMAVLAANQGLYNGFLATGLLISLFFTNPQVCFAFQAYFLSCVFIAGVYGAYSVKNRRIFFIQALPAILGLLLLLFLVK